MKKQIIGLIAALVLVLIVVSSFILYNQWPLMAGKKVVLATQPVDPFDPFKGQYIAISYEISRINNLSDFEEKDIIYISLKEDERGIWRYDDTSKSKPSKGDFIKGKVTSVYENSVRVEYGIEQFFFERHAQLPTSNITVEVSITSSGRAKISQLLHNGEPIKIKYEPFDIKS